MQAASIKRGAVGAGLAHRRTFCRVPSVDASQTRSIRCKAQQEQQPSVDDARLIASLTSIGLNGTLAIGLSKLAGVDLYSQFHGLGGFDLQVTAACLALIAGYEALLLGIPWYAPFLKAAAQAASGSTIPTAGSSATSSSSSSSVKDAGDDRSGTGTSGTGSTGSAEAGSEASSSSSKKRGPPKPFNMQLRMDDEAMQGPVALQQTLAMQQACYCATQTMLKGDSPLALDLGLVVMRESAKELLQRGLLVTFLAGWAADRAFEAGADDVAAIVGGVTVYTTEAARWGMAVLATLAMLPPIWADAKAISLSVATNWAVLATSGGDESDEDELLNEYRLYDALQKAVDAPPSQLTQAAHGVRGLLRFAAINTAFAATSNLAASLTIAVLSNWLLMAYSAKGAKDLRLTRKPPSGRGPPGSGGNGAKQRKPPSLKWPQDDQQ